MRIDFAICRCVRTEYGKRIRKLYESHQISEKRGNMQKLKQMVVMRENHERDEGTMGFHDCVTVKEDFNKFVDRVTEACETVNGKFLGVSYPNEDTAVILYRWSDGLH